MLVFKVIRAVNTAVHAVVGEVQRSKHYNSVAVKVLFNLFGKVINPVNPLLVLTGEEHGRLTVGKTLSVFRLFNYLVHKCKVILVLIGVSEGFHNLIVIYKLLRFE